MLVSKKIIALLSCASLAVTAASASARDTYPCFYADEQQSARIHDFQILMMVGALKCRDVAPGSVGRYGAMLAQRDQEMAAHGDRLLARMIDERGYREGRRAFDTYETMLSNAYSEWELTRESCEDLGAQARMALEATPAELETLARLASRREIDLCEAGGGAARVIAPRSRPLVAAYPEERAAVRVFRGAVPPQVAAATREFPDMVSAPVAEPRIEEEAALAAEAADAAASVSEAAERIAEAEAEAAVAVAAATKAQAASAPPATRLDEAISALDNAANALRNLRDEQAKPGTE